MKYYTYILFLLAIFILITAIGAYADDSKSYTIKWSSRDVVYTNKLTIHKPVKEGRNISAEIFIDDINIKGMPDWLEVTPVFIPACEGGGFSGRRKSPKPSWRLGATQKQSYTLPVYSQLHKSLKDRLVSRRVKIRWFRGANYEPVHLYGADSTEPDALMITWRGMVNDPIYINVRHLDRFTPGILSSARLDMYILHIDDTEHIILSSISK